MSTTVSRFNASVPKNKDNSSRGLLNDYQAKAYAASIAVTTDARVHNTLVKVAQLTGALTVTIGVANPLIGDRVTLLFGADGTNRIVTFSTGFASAGTLTVTASKFASAVFMFDGTSWVEVSRAITA
jgi:hypothetical protein